MTRLPLRVTAAAALGLITLASTACTRAHYALPSPTAGCEQGAGRTLVEGDDVRAEPGQAILPVAREMVRPVADGTTTLTSGFGPRGGTVHQGIDLAGPVGTPIYAAADGVVVKAGPATGFGYWVVIDHDLNGELISTVYGHMYGADVWEGDVVEAGQKIAEIGNNGQSTGPHLHWEIWRGGRLQGGTADPGVEGAFQASKPIGDSEGWGDGASPSTDSQIVLASSSRVDCNGFGTPGGSLQAGSVPAEFEKWLVQAGSICPGIDAPLLAAQLSAENGFRHGNSAPVSQAGAMGPAQFMPGTWASYGRDHDGDGRVDVNSIGDAVMAQGHYMCDLYGQMGGYLEQGRVSGDQVELAVAAYNAGPGAVLQSGRVPRNGETEMYVSKIMAERAKYTSPMARGELVVLGRGDGAKVVEAARHHLGLPYVWGGGNINGPTGGGFDCSGLTSYAVYAGSGNAVQLPRTSEQQWTVGTEVPMSAARPGDLVFGSWHAGGPGHVGIYIGNGMMIHAPTTGDVVKEAPVQADMRARRVM